MDQRSAFSTAGGTATNAGATRPSTVRSYGRLGATPACSWLTDAVQAKPVAAIRMFTEVPNHRTRRLFGASP